MPVVHPTCTGTRLAHGLWQTGLTGTIGFAIPFGDEGFVGTAGDDDGGSVVVVLLLLLG